MALFVLNMLMLARVPDLESPPAIRLAEVAVAVALAPVALADVVDYRVLISLVSLMVLRLTPGEP